MADQQPEALLLAECLEQHEYCTLGQMDRAAAELRRLHEVEKQRDELLAALKKVSLTAVYVGNGESSLAFDVVKEVDAAIAKAEGKS